MGMLIAYLMLAYIILPALWSHHEHEPGLASLPMVTRTADDIPGDALNVGLVGSKDDVLRAMHAAGWYPADPITLRSSIEIIGSVVLDRPYHDAPVSPLYYDGKKEQLSFEKPEGKSADRRHHVRFWQVLDKGTDGRPVWLGSVTFDRGVGLSHDTGQVTHHIAPDIDAERDGLMRDLGEAGVVQNFFQISGTGPTLFGRNGEGDAYYTDGEIDVATLVIDGATPARDTSAAAADRAEGSSLARRQQCNQPIVVAARRLSFKRARRSVSSDTIRILTARRASR